MQDYNFRGFGVVRAGMAMVWDAQNHWRVIAAAKACSSTGYPCKLVWEDGAALSAVPGDLVFLNVTRIPGQPYAGYEVSLPYKELKTGFSTAYPLEQARITGTFGDVYEFDVDDCEKLPSAPATSSRCPTPRPTTPRRSRSAGTSATSAPVSRASSHSTVLSFVSIGVMRDEEKAHLHLSQQSHTHSQRQKIWQW